MANTGIGEADSAMNNTGRFCPLSWDLQRRNALIGNDNANLSRSDDSFRVGVVAYGSVWNLWHISRRQDPRVSLHGKSQHAKDDATLKVQTIVIAIHGGINISRGSVYYASSDHLDPTTTLGVFRCCRRGYCASWAMIEMKSSALLDTNGSPQLENRNHDVTPLQNQLWTIICIAFIYRAFPDFSIWAREVNARFCQAHASRGKRKGRMKATAKKTSRNKNHFLAVERVTSVPVLISGESLARKMPSCRLVWWNKPEVPCKVPAIFHRLLFRYVAFSVESVPWMRRWRKARGAWIFSLVHITF